MPQIIQRVALLMLAPTASAQEGKPDFRLDANEFAKEVYNDGPAA
ncbi:hypothetical protein R5W23_001379 [Gemmata sp. JC673]|uniref:Uncharacterized protein n=1 Tax=Gemmata algarum TaxID=2975278 RepID=A0ABU5EY29_9BACT|nr:hypothetical protein [Gemmata algarum]MDY3560154.1 hypothetical protein [Gemmata algarum]